MRMTMGKHLGVVLSCALLLCALTVPALAHGGHHSRAADNAVCPVEDCQMTGTHSHDGTEYCGHTRNDGHAHHSDCAVEGCRVLRAHTHHAAGRHGHHC